ncbi:MAG: hypothetical protein PWP31_436 [Clostridia bacterium]|nr:hypothetical protein [Clostridia bacterium]
MLNLLFFKGKFCTWCGRPFRYGAFCHNCLEKLDYSKQQLKPCKYCGRFLPLNSSDICSQCQVELPVFHKARAVGAYRGILKEMIWELKYKGRRSLVKPLGQLLANITIKALRTERPHIIVPVPLTKFRLRARTFNQSELLALALGKELGISVGNDILIRTKETIPQAGLSRQQRWRNLAGAFRVKEPSKIRGSHLLLVDDVLTTGATASVCTHFLLGSGAVKITVVTLATGIEKSNYSL